ncbi:unnamed protein product [Darwinula stevensoni]|uniref:HCLS1-associated protein X-1 n=1 Tax=Darwinula stevensoni TaxID=69355 RepID=A0A7R8ZXV5_9CRUS|nr:unnamed protein product [Darwinula stevensoni]CAG0880177.1 unnamed protein product [Darwinula stevensoni]
MVFKRFDFPDIQHIIGFDMLEDIDNYSMFTILVVQVRPNENSMIGDEDGDDDGYDIFGHHGGSTNDPFFGFMGQFENMFHEMNELFRRDFPGLPHSEFPSITGLYLSHFISNVMTKQNVLEACGSFWGGPGLQGDQGWNSKRSIRDRMLKDELEDQMRGTEREKEDMALDEPLAEVAINQLFSSGSQGDRRQEQDYYRPRITVTGPISSSSYSYSYSSPGSSVSVRRVQLPDGTVEEEKVIRDSSGKEEREFKRILPNCDGKTDVPLTVEPDSRPSSYSPRERTEIVSSGEKDSAFMSLFRKFFGSA